ncbi:MAG: tyrosine--tRNA ligase [Phycisphaeraceae bacterium]|nr:tyrosine--tRNA ligase [Phycisphaerales bacterium]MCB9842419.1 tyrosine--tRNA ligase [Phycisphaeraceae bacterium]
MNDLLTELRERSLLYQATDEDALRKHLVAGDRAAGGRRIYTGFDPTADSLTIGNLVPIMLLRKMQQAGHTPFVLLGGATGLIGDPSGKESERSLRTRDEVDFNVDAQRKIFERLLNFDAKSPNHARMVNNIDWFEKISFLDALRDIGKHFSVNEMTKRDSVRDRLEREQGISYTEFSYMLLQAYDFLHLFRAEGVTIQSAGADQWGNIVSGADLIRRCEHNDTGSSLSFGFTAPLLTKADGGKFGKTESGAIWLSHKRPSGTPGTSPYAYYQFWLNTSDADVRKYLCIFTDLSLAEINDLCAKHASEPHLREAQRTLAQHATTLLHGGGAMRAAEDAAKALFSGEVRALDADTLDEVFAAVPSTTHDKASLGGGVSLVDVLAATSLAKSKSEARKHLEAGAVSVNGDKADADRTLTPNDLLYGRVVLLRRGKKSWHVTRWA